MRLTLVEVQPPTHNKMRYSHKTKDRMIKKLREEREDLRATIKELRRECIIKSPRHMAGTLEPPARPFKFLSKAITKLSAFSLSTK